MPHHHTPPVVQRKLRAPPLRAPRTAAATSLARLQDAFATLLQATTPRALRKALAESAALILPGIPPRVTSRGAARSRGTTRTLVPRGSGRGSIALELPAGADGSLAKRLALQLLVDFAGQVHARLRLAARGERLREEAEHDFLTGIFNRRLAMRLLDRELHQARRRHRPLALVMVDVDNFKTFNDHHGHQAGDDVLRQLARLIAVTARASDIVGRFGGEEFLIALPDTSIEDAALFAERLRQEVERYGKLELARYGDHPPTISIGVCPITPDDTLESAIERADRALYESKSRGRNCFSLGLSKGVPP